MTNLPCKSAYRSELCPPLSDSESDGEQKPELSKSSKESLSFVGSKTSLRGSQEGKKPSETTKAECFFVDPSTIEAKRVDSILKLESNAEQLQVKIEQISLEKQSIQDEICEKKKLLMDAIEKVIEIEKSIEALEAVIADKLHHFQTRLIDLETKRTDIFKNSGDGKVRELLEREIEVVKEDFALTTKRDEADKEKITQQAQLLAASLGNVIELYETFFNDMMAEAFEKKSSEETLQSKRNFEANTILLRQLLDRPAQFCEDKAGERFYLNRDGDRVYKVEAYSSEYKLNADGDREKIKNGFSLSSNENGEFYNDSGSRKIYTKHYFEDDFGRFYIDIHGNRHYKADAEASEYILVGGNWKKAEAGTYQTDEQGLRLKLEPEVEIKKEDFEVTVEERAEKLLDDDLAYIKRAVGTAIRKGLAAVVLHKPMDPVNYFVNFLFHYRHNQRMFEKREQDMKDYLELRVWLNEDEKKNLKLREKLQ